MVLILTQDRSMVCVQRTIGSEIVLDALDGTTSDKAEVPDLSVRWINSICGGGDSRDPTTNEQVVAP